MSAYIVDHALLRYLVAAAVEWGLASEPDARALGQLLLDENTKSVDHRYRETNEREPYEHGPAKRAIEPLRVISAVNCLAYQSCEHDDFEDGAACEFLDALRDVAVARLPERFRGFTLDRWGHETAAYRTAPGYADMHNTLSEFEPEVTP